MSSGFTAQLIVVAAPFFGVASKCCGCGMKKDTTSYVSFIPARLVAGLYALGKAVHGGEPCMGGKLSMVRAMHGGRAMCGRKLRMGGKVMHGGLHMEED